jgi:GAF domain-containing protein
VKSYLGVPLIVKEEVLGVLNLYSQEELLYDYRFQKPLVRAFSPLTLKT